MERKSSLSFNERIDKDKTKLKLRVCVACRRESSREELLRLTIDYKSGQVFLNTGKAADRFICGRSAYLCSRLSCLDQALKGNRLRISLEGRRGKKTQAARRVAWPLESQLIHTMRSQCTEILETCQNTPSKEGD